MPQTVEPTGKLRQIWPDDRMRYKNGKTNDNTTKPKDAMIRTGRRTQQTNNPCSAALMVSHAGCDLESRGPGRYMELFHSLGK